MKNFNNLWMLAAAMSLAVSFTSCSDDDNSADATMTVNKIYLENASSTTTNHDREVEFARLGQLIRIEGQGFMGLKKIYINGYETYFNNALMTDNNVWVSLSAKTPIMEAEEDVRNTITLYKSDGNKLVYKFSIRAASPSITSISNTLPNAGDEIRVEGTNLQGVTSVTLPSGNNVPTTACDDLDGEWFTFNMPDGETTPGSLTCEGANGIAKSPAYFLENRAYIINFDGLGAQGGWSATFSSEDLVDDPLNAGHGKVCQIIPPSQMEAGGVGSGVASIKGFYTAGGEKGAWSDPDENWQRMVDAGVFSAADNLNDVALQFDCYVPDAWNKTGQVTITLQNNLNSYGYNGANTNFGNSAVTATAYAWVPWLNRETGEAVEFKTTGWQTVTVPLSKFGDYQDGEDHTFQEVLDMRAAASYANFGIIFSNPDLQWDKNAEEPEYPSMSTSQLIYIDNLRLVPCAAITVSDFED